MDESLVQSFTLFSISSSDGDWAWSISTTVARKGWIMVKISCTLQQEQILYQDNSLPSGLSVITNANHINFWRLSCLMICSLHHEKLRRNNDGNTRYIVLSHQLILSLLTWRRERTPVKRFKTPEWFCNLALTFYAWNFTSTFMRLYQLENYR